jgi:hypothetical protein
MVVGTGNPETKRLPYEFRDFHVLDLELRAARVLAIEDTFSVANEPWLLQIARRCFLTLGTNPALCMKYS